MWFLLAAHASWSLDCLDNKGKPVAWWVIFKPPGSLGNSHIYLDSTMSNGKPVLESVRMDSKGTALQRTFSSTPAASPKLAWNDESQSKNSSSSAHSKGVMAWDNSGNSSSPGYYLLHSLPTFPYISSGGTINTTMDSSENIYGQHLFCTSLKLSQLNDLANLMQYSQVNTYFMNFPNNSNTKYLTSLGEAKIKATSPFLNKTINLNDGSHMTILSKANKINASIFEDGLVGLFGLPFVAETWGRPLEDSWCPKKGATVTNSRTINMFGLEWNETQDHSKWAIADSTSQNVVCLGDMNRMTSQWKRGGTFLCLRKPLHDFLNTAIVSRDTCSGGKVITGN
jgi:deoxyribonuclease-2